MDRKTLLTPAEIKKAKSRKVSILAFIQARTTSTRLPNKIYKEINGAPILYHTVGRAKESIFLNDVVLCSPHQLPDVPPETKEFIHQGDERDVLTRYFKCFEFNPCDYIVRLTSDCPLLDPNLIDFVIAHGLLNKADYCSNVIKLTFPDGVDCEFLSKDMLMWLHETVRAPYHREHVTSLLRDDPNLREQFQMVSVESNEDLSRNKWSVDTEEDLQRLRQMEREAYE